MYQFSQMKYVCMYRMMFLERFLYDSGSLYTYLSLCHTKTKEMNIVLKMHMDLSIQELSIVL